MRRKCSTKNICHPFQTLPEGGKADSDSSTASQHWFTPLVREAYCASLRKSRHHDQLAHFARTQQTYVFCRGLDALALCLVWLFVPGTGRQIATMEEMDRVFGVATKHHVQYQAQEVAYWCVDHYVRRRRGNDLPPLARWQHEREDTTSGDGGIHGAARGENSAGDTEGVVHINGAAKEDQKNE